VFGLTAPHRIRRSISSEKKSKIPLAHDCGSRAVFIDNSRHSEGAIGVQLCRSEKWRSLE